jgi:flagellar biosynthesis/type III secretory pathway protein FliH
MSNGENIERKITKALEYVGEVVGLPFKNIDRIANSISRMFALAGSERGIEIARFFSSQTKAQAFNESIKTGNKAEMNVYVSDQFDNIAVQKEIIRLLTVEPDVDEIKRSIKKELQDINSDLKDARNEFSKAETSERRAYWKNRITELEQKKGELSSEGYLDKQLTEKPMLNIRNVTSFTKVIDGKTVKYKIPDDIKQKYNGLAQKAMQQLIKSSAYKRLKDADKLKAIQRVINYYYNYMKTIVLGENLALLSVSDVAGKAITQ